MSLIVRKHVLGVSDRLRNKVDCIKESLRRDIADLETTVKFLNFRTSTNFTVSTLKCKLSRSTLVFYL